MPTTDPSDLVKQHKERQEEAMLAEVPNALAACADTYYGRVLALAISTRDTTIRSLRSDLAARDALCGELRTQGTAIVAWLPDTPAFDMERETWKLLCARTPSDAGAELARHREALADVEATSSAILPEVAKRRNAYLNLKSAIDAAREGGNQS